MRKSNKKRSMVMAIFALLGTLTVGATACDNLPMFGSSQASSVESETESSTALESVDSTVNSQEEASSETIESTESADSSENSEDSENNDSSEDSGNLEETPTQNALVILADEGEVYPYIDGVKEYLEAGEGANVADYHYSVTSQYAPVQVKWRYYAEGAKKFVVEYATKADYSDAYSVEVGAAKRSADIYNLYKGTTYYVRVKAVDKNNVILHYAESVLQTTDLGPRFMYIDDVHNVRDLGGYVTETGKTLVQGIAYRGGTLTVPPETEHYFNSITEEGKQYMSEVMGIKTEIDFRTARESGISVEDGSVIPGATLTYITLNGYEDTFYYTDEYKQFFTMLANPNSYPMYMHCTGGADRTGTVVFLLHALLGVSELECVQGYELTSFSTYGLRNMQDGTYKDHCQAFLTKLKSFAGETLQDKAETWVLSLGITQEQIDTIRGIFYGEIAIGENAVTPRVAQKKAAAKTVTYEQTGLGKVKLVGTCNNKQVYITSVESGIKYPVSDWDAAYQFSYASGNGITINGEMINMHNTVKSIGNTMYIALGDGVNAGDILKIGGVLRCEGAQVEYVISDSAFRWNGTEWEEYEDGSNYDPDSDLIGYAAYHITGIKATSKSTAELVNIYSGAGDLLPKEQGNWDDVFKLRAGSGTGLTLNGVSLAGTGIKMPGDLYVPLGVTAWAGDVLVLDGVYYNDNLKIKLIFDNCALKWDGTSWTPCDAPIEYTTYNLGELVVSQIGGDNNQFVYFTTKSGEKIPVYSTENNMHWELVFAWKGGLGVTVNYATVNATVKYPHDMFIDLKNAPNVGDVLKVGGVFYNDEIGVQYIVEESVFEWDGSTWVPYVDYRVYELGTLAPIGEQVFGASIALNRTDGETFAVNNVGLKFTFYAESGIGVTLNGEPLTGASLKSTTSKLYLDLGARAKSGDVVTIGGLFYNVEAGAQYIIADCSFIYENEVWTPYTTEYTEIGMGEVYAFADASTESFAYFLSSNTAITLPIDSWDEEDSFVCAFGTGIQWNGETLENVKIRSIDSTIYVAFGAPASKGTVMAIGGKFVCESQKVLYYVSDCTMIWNGEAWVDVAGESFTQWKETLTNELMTYKNAENYGKLETGRLQVIFSMAKEDIISSESWVELANVVADAKVKMDAIATLSTPQETVGGESVMNYNNHSSSAVATAQKTTEEPDMATGCNAVAGLSVSVTALGAAAMILRKKED